jgi:hypothetical protein
MFCRKYPGADEQSEAAAMPQHDKCHSEAMPMLTLTKLLKKVSC